MLLAVAATHAFVPTITLHFADVFLARRAVQLPTADVIDDPLLWHAGSNRATPPRPFGYPSAAALALC